METPKETPTEKTVGDRIFETFYGVINDMEYTHLIYLLTFFCKLPGLTLLRAGYTADGIMAEVRYSLDHKDYVVEIKEKK